MNQALTLTGYARLRRGNRVLSPWKHNMILDQGLDGLAERAIADSFLYACLGTDGTANYEDSGTDTITVADNFITFSAEGWLEGDDTDRGKVFQLNDGTVYVIVLEQSTTTAYVGEVDDHVAEEFTYYLTQQTGLVAEVCRSNLYETCGTRVITGGLRLYRALVMDVAPSTWDIAEVGLSWSSAAGNNLFSRIVLDDPVTLTEGSLVSLDYYMDVTFGPLPTNPIDVTSPWNNWPDADGLLCWEYPAICTVNTNGTTRTSIGPDQDWAPSGELYSDATDGVGIQISEDMEDFQDFGGNGVVRDTGRVAKSVTCADYVAGTYYRDKYVTFEEDEANSDVLRTICLGTTIKNNGHGLVFITNQPQTKTEGDEFTPNFRVSVERRLTT